MPEMWDRMASEGRGDLDALEPVLRDSDLLIVEAALIRLLEAPGSYYYEEVLQKRSLTGDSASGPCPVCDDNEAEGWIDSEDVYPSGDDAPPFHPNCVCSEEYRESRRRVYV